MMLMAILPRERVDSMNDAVLERVVVAPKLMVGKKVLRGTRIPVERVGIIWVGGFGAAEGAEWLAAWGSAACLPSLARVKACHTG